MCDAQHALERQHKGILSLTGFSSQNKGYEALKGRVLGILYFQVPIHICEVTVFRILALQNV